jgi:hypothetical protein
MKTRSFVLLFTVALLATLPIRAQLTCVPVGGVLMTNIAAIDNVYNLGPVFGDLQGSVAAKIVSANASGTYTLQHYWVISTGLSVRATRNRFFGLQLRQEPDALMSARTDLCWGC